MLPESYFESLLKHKSFFNDAEIALMTPKQSMAYRITGHIHRNKTNEQETKYLLKLIKHLENKINYINFPMKKL